LVTFRKVVQLAVIGGLFSLAQLGGYSANQDANLTLAPAVVRHQFGAIAESGLAV